MVDQARQRQSQTPESAPDQNTSAIGDLVGSIGTALYSVPDTVRGIADIPFGLAGFDRPITRAAEAVDDFIGFSPTKIAENRRKLLTPETQQQVQNVSQAVEEADGFTASVGAGARAYLQNPRALIPLLGEALPSTIVPAGIAAGLTRGASLAARRAAPVLAEGAFAGGMAQQGISDDVDPQRRALAAAGSAITTGAFGAGGGAIARRLGIVDPDFIFVDGVPTLPAGAARKKLASRVLGGAVSEGLLEELPQGVSETMLANWAEGNALTEGLDRAVVDSVFAGGIMGAAFNLRGARQQLEPTDGTGKAPDNTGRTGGTQTMRDRSVKDLQKSFSSMSTLAEAPDGDPDIQQRAVQAMADIRSEMIRRGMDPRLANERLATTVYLDNAARLREMRVSYLEALETNPQKANTILQNTRRIIAKQDSVRDLFPGVEAQAAQGELEDLLDTNRKLVTRLGKAREKRNGSEQQVLRGALQENRSRLEQLIDSNEGLTIPQKDRKNAGTAGRSRAAPAQDGQVAAQPAEDTRPEIERDSAAIAAINTKQATNELAPEISEKLFKKDGSLKGGKKVDRPAGFFNRIKELPISQLARLRKDLESAESASASWKIELVEAVLANDRLTEFQQFSTEGQPLTAPEALRLLEDSPLTQAERSRIQRVATLREEGDPGVSPFTTVAQEENVSTKSIRDSYKGALNKLAREVQLAKNLDSVEEAQAMLDELLGVTEPAAGAQAPRQAFVPEAELAEADLIEQDTAAAAAREAAATDELARQVQGAELARAELIEQAEAAEAAGDTEAAAGLAQQAQESEQAQADLIEQAGVTAAERTAEAEDNRNRQVRDLEISAMLRGQEQAEAVEGDVAGELGTDEASGSTATMGIRNTANSKQGGSREPPITLENFTKFAGFLPARRELMDALATIDDPASDIPDAARAEGLAKRDKIVRKIKELESADRAFLREQQLALEQLADLETETRALERENSRLERDQATLPEIQRRQDTMATMESVWNSVMAEAPAADLELTFPDVQWAEVSNDARLLRVFQQELNNILRDLQSAGLQRYPPAVREQMQLKRATEGVNYVLSSLSTIDGAGDRRYISTQAAIEENQDAIEENSAALEKLRESVERDSAEVREGLADFARRVGNSEEGQRQVARMTGATAAFNDSRQRKGRGANATENEELISQANEAALAEFQQDREAHLETLEADFSVQLRVVDGGVNTAKSLRAELQRIFRARKLPPNIRIVEDAFDLQEALDDAGIPDTVAAAVQGVVTPDGTVYLVAQNIPQGKELGVVMHEVGVHAGLERMGSDRKIAELINQLKVEPPGTDLGKAVVRARIRLSNARAVLRRDGIAMSQVQEDSELLAYTVEEGTNMMQGRIASQEAQDGSEAQDGTAGQKSLRLWMAEFAQWVRSVVNDLFGTPINTGGGQLELDSLLSVAMGFADAVVRQGIEESTPDGQQSEHLRQLRTHDGPGQFSLSAAQLTERWESQMPDYMRAGWRSFNKTARQTLRKFIFTNTLAETTENILAGVGEWDATSKRRISERNVIDGNTQGIVDPLQGKPELSEKVSEFAMKAQRARTWGFDPAAWGFDMESQTVDPALAQEFDALPEEGQQIVAGMMRHAFALRQEMNRQMGVNMQMEYDSLIEKTVDETRRRELQDDLARQLTKLEAQGNTILPSYLPLRRFGNYAVVFKSRELKEALNAGDQQQVDELKQDPEHYLVEFHETAFSGERKLLVMQREMGDAGDVEFFERQRMDVSGEFIPFNMVEAMRARLEGGTEVDPNTGEERTNTSSALLSSLSKLYIHSLSEDSARKSELQRTNVAGADPDMVRAFVAHASSMSATIAALKINRETNQVLQSMKNDASNPNHPPGVRDRKQEVLNEVLYRHSHGINPKPDPATDALLGTTSFFMLLTSPAYYIQNATQPFMLTAPVMGGRHGFANSVNSLLSNYKKLGRTWNKGTSGALSNISPETIPDPDELDLLDELQNLGLLDVGMAADLGSFKTPGGLLSTTAIARTHQKFIHMVRTVELFNRGVSAISAYQLELKKNNGDKAAAKKYAIKIVYDTQGDYSGQNAPSVIDRMWAGRLITQFRKFQVIQLTVLARVGAGMFDKSDPVEQAIAKRQMMYILGMHGAVGGMMGLPTANLIGWALGNMFGDDDEPDDIELRVAQAINDRQISDLIMRGIPTLFGMDVSSRLGMGLATSLLPFTEIELSRDGAAALIAGVLGPSSALFQQAYDGAGQMANGQVMLGVAQMLPRGLRDAMRAFHYKTEGVTRRNMSQDVALSPDEVSYMDAILTGLGWPTATLTDRQKINNWLFSTEKVFDSRSAEIRGEYARTDSGAVRARLRREFLQLQATRVKYGFGRQPLSNLLDERQAKQDRERDIVGGVLTNSQNRRFVQRLQE